MRLGDHHAGRDHTDPTTWATSVRALGYGTALPPACLEADDTTVDQIDAFRAAAADHDLVVGEVGGWSNPIDPDPAKAKDGHDKCVRMLRRADRLGALCCANIAGSRDPNQWDGPHASHFTDEVFALIVSSIQRVIDEADPKHTVYAIETMPWVPPDSPEEALRLVEAVDRPGRFAIHLDPANLINCPRRAYDSAGFIRHCFDVLGEHIVAVHAKDIALEPRMTTHLQECRPGLGLMDFETLVRCAEDLDPDLPVYCEHLPNADEYAMARATLVQAAERAGVALR